uniref:Uncharacterized protein n=1 Tax=Plectus sambesii TaxID=2011161 RepID=A0A914VAD5_9BILA
MNNTYQQPLYVSTNNTLIQPQFPNASAQTRSPGNGTYLQPIYIPMASSNSVYSTPRSTITAYSPAATPITYSPSPRSTNGEPIFFTPQNSTESANNEEYDDEKSDCAPHRSLDFIVIF